ncbi:tRNA1(Val) (adenine(37)-N6)-methyltransferase [Acetobacter sp.]|uniref:tRNA1(Val) (adenine(37)-N6)-methyltransferase n=1 Tax=Acetobacter sp. TaxID=440 RepID=UPI0039EC9967
MLGGRIAYQQFRNGYRTGLEPVLMAALVPARPGERVLEAGCGAGAGLLCLTARVPQLTAIGIELDSETAALAAANAATNERPNIHIVSGDICNAAVLPPGSSRFDHVFANPPWHRTDATASPHHRRDRARRAQTDTFVRWIQSLSALLRQKGSMTLALPSSRLAEALAACEATGIGSVEMVPLWPHAGEEARIVLLRGRQGGQAGSRLLPGLVLHNERNDFTPQAQALLREGHALFPDSFRKAGRSSVLQITRTESADKNVL